MAGRNLMRVTVDLFSGRPNPSNSALARSTALSGVPASLQPPLTLFFSFQCYIDLLWWQWQDEFEIDTDLDAAVRPGQGPRASAENRFRVSDTPNIEAQLGYVFSACRSAAPTGPTRAA